MTDRWISLDKSRAIALIRPAVSRWQLYRWYAPLASHEPPLGLLYIASHLAEHRQRVSLLDGEQIGRNQILKRLRSLRPGIVGITSTTFSFGQAQKLADEVRSLLPDCLLLMGGSHVSALPVETLNRVPVLDACVVGEGEDALLAIAQGIRPDCIPGLVWRDDSEGIRTNTARDGTADLDRYQPDWSLLEQFPASYQPGLQDRRGRRTASLVASRGCSYSCTFCAGPLLHGRRRRAHTPRQIVEQMTKLRTEYDVRDFYFHDDNFTQDRAWLMEFCDRLIQGQTGVNWSCASRTESLSDQVLARMREAGCLQIGIGIESGSDSILEWLNKGVTFERMSDSIKQIHSAGIATKLYLIIGTPIETIPDLMKSLRRVMRLHSSHIQIIYFTPLPGSFDGQRVLHTERDWPRMNLLTPIGLPLWKRVALRSLELGFYSCFYSRRLFLKIAHSREVGAPKGPSQ